MRRLYLEIYAAFLLIAACCVLAAGGMGSLLFGDGPEVPPPARGVAAWIAESLPPPGDPGFQAALERISGRVRLDLTLWDADGRLLGAAGAPMPAGFGSCPREGWVHGRGGHGFLLRLEDGRCLGASYAGARARRARHLAGLVVFPVLFGLVAAGTWPLARRITRRLELLQRSMERFGRGELGVRAVVQGRDEVAELARSFNDAAGRVEALVNAQRRVLASASHELRSPLARLRVALELLEREDGDPEHTAVLDEARRDVGELDQLIGDVLLAARLEARALVPQREELELRALIREEAARVEATVSGPEALLRGDRALLRSLARNLLENARRHGGGPVEAWLEPGPDRVLLVVADRGRGVPEPERERIFEPFYRPADHREASGGVGLGLALVRWIAEAHGGTARYAPREGGGSRFEVELPRA